MNPSQILIRRPLFRLPEFRPRVLLAAIALIGALPASAAPFTYRYYQFKPTALKNNGTVIQVSEFTFSNGGTLLNLNNRDGTGVNVVPVTPTSAGQGTGGGEDPPRIVDGLPLVTGGSPATKWLRGGATTDGNELVFDFTTPTTVDRYNFCTGGDDTAYNRTPVSWRISGRNATTDAWTLLDVRVNAITVASIANNTYQVGWDLPVDVPPVINNFAVHSLPLPGTAAIVLNGSSVTLDWNTSYASAVTLFSPDVPAGSVVAAVASQSFTPPPEATSAYTLVATKDGSAAAVSTQLVRTVAGGSKTYRYVRYTITGRRATGTGLVQLAEFEFYNGDATVAANKVMVATATNPGGSNSAPESMSNEKVDKLYDGILTTAANKWLDGNMRPVIFDFGVGKTFDRYLFVTGGDAPDRDPVLWKLEGSDDLSRWDLIENVDFPYPTTTARNASTLSIPLPGASLPTSIDFFTGNTGTLIEGDSLVLSYSTQGAASVTITPDFGDPVLLPNPPPLYGSVTVNPTGDTTYTLEVTPVDPNDPVLTATFSVFVITDPGVNDIAYDDFSNAGVEINMNGSASITPPASTLPGRLRITPEQQGQQGTAWFLKKLNATVGFEATFGLSMNQELPNGFAPADGMAFVVQNSPSGTNDPGTGENGVTQNALNICFHSFGFAADPASVVEVRSGTTVLGRSVTYLKPGVELHGIPGFPYTLGSLASAPAYQIRVVYTPNNLDVYMDGVAVVQNVNVDLGAIGATDANGKSYFGFTARTGGNIQNSDITGWHVRLGDFSELPPFGIVKTLFRYTPGNPSPTSVDLVWNASITPSYDTVSSLDLITWDLISTETGVNGQIGVTIDIPFNVGTASSAFFRVEQHTGN